MLGGVLVAAALAALQQDGLPTVTEAELQPVRLHVSRLREAMAHLGMAFPEGTAAKLDAAGREDDPARALTLIQEALDPLCLAGVSINPESRVKVGAGPAAPVLVEQGWRQFLVKVKNEAGVTAPLRAASPQAASMHNAPRAKLEDRWLGLRMFDGRPLAPKLSGIGLEYRIVQLYSRDAGKRAAVLAFDVGQGTQDLGFRNDVTITFTAAASTPVTFRVLDEKGTPTTAGFVIRDALGRTYPSQAKRRAPDFAFHPQIYRADGETIHLPAGAYTVAVSRGPEYLPAVQTLTVGKEPTVFTAELKRWIDPSTLGWWSGDHHIHAAGCAHYTDPTEGVHPPDMMRHCLGEDLKIGANLTWGPCFDYQKQFFTGKVDKVSQYPYLLRYDVEVSGFGSHRSGHLCLLRLKEQIYPGGESKHHWPTLCLNTLKWAKKQGALVGPAHSGWGLAVPGPDLPNYAIPPFNGIGANEYIVDVTHEVEGPDGTNVPAVDFLSMVDTPSRWELNIWYHTLNAGFRTRVSGETDFPCIYGERVGLGRAYVKLDGKLTYDGWCEGVRKGHAYVADGRSHLLDMKVNDVALGSGDGELRLDGSGDVTVTLQAAAYLPVEPDPGLRARPLDRKPYWHLERARLGDTRTVPVELVVNGHAVARQTLTADGALRTMTFKAMLDRSSWVAVRILPSSHTNPIFVVLDGRPIRPSRKSVAWCLKSVDRCWSQKKKLIAPAEMKDAKAAYAHARKVYAKRLAESVKD